MNIVFNILNNIIRKKIDLLILHYVSITFQKILLSCGSPEFILSIHTKHRGSGMLVTPFLRVEIICFSYDLL